MTTKDLDDAIDRAVRDIMSAEPRPGFRGRVLDRLESRDSDHRARESRSWRAPRTWRLAVPAFAGALALAVIVLVVMQRRPDAPTQPAPSTAVATLPAPASPVAGPPSTPAAVPRRVPAPDVQRLPRGLVHAASVDEAAAAPLAEDALLEPLNQVAPLSVAPIADTRLQTRDISVGELSLPPIAVEPLPLPGGGPVYPREDR